MAKTGNKTRRGNQPRPAAPSKETTAAESVVPQVQPEVQKPGQPRQTEPKSWHPFVLGGSGILARRGPVDPLFGQTAQQLADFATSSPMKLLALLPEIHPGVGLALWNALRLMCPTSGIKLVAKRKPKGANSAGVLEPDPAGTESIAKMFASLPSEINGVDGLMVQLAIQAMFTGMACAEGVPGARLQGLRRIWPVDSMSIWFARPNRDADLQPYQRQRYPIGTLQGVQGQQLRQSLPPSPAGLPGLMNGMYQPLSIDRFKWVAVDPMVDEPYGRAPYATALSEVIADLALMQDLRDSIHNAAWPRYEIGVNKSELHKVAVEVYKITNPVKAAEWVNARFDEICDYVENMGPGDNIVTDSNGHTRALQPGSFQGLEGVLDFLRLRIVQALKTLPSLMGVGEVGTQFTSVEWTIYVEGLETLRALIASILIWMGNLHLRLIGSTSVCEAEYEKIKTNDSLIEANTESVRILNVTNKEKLGFVSHDEAAVEVTGHPARATAQPGVIEPLPDAQVATTSPTDKQESNRPGNGVQGTRKNGADGQKKIPQNPNSEGTNKEERGTRKPKSYFELGDGADTMAYAQSIVDLSTREVTSHGE